MVAFKPLGIEVFVEKLLIGALIAFLVLMLVCCGGMLFSSTLGKAADWSSFKWKTPRHRRAHWQHRVMLARLGQLRQPRKRLSSR